MSFKKNSSLQGPCFGRLYTGRASGGGSVENLPGLSPGLRQDERWIV
jgi:hypothetical protein